MSDQKALARRILPLIDLTNLADDCAEADIVELCGKATTPHGPVAAVCIYPPFIAQAKQLLEGTGVRVATVTNFPSGGSKVRIVVGRTVKAYAAGADEVDVVFPVKSFLHFSNKIAAELVANCAAIVPEGRTLKVILETGMLADPRLIRKAAALAIDEGAHFIKTSTGKAPVNATPEAARIMLEEIKASGKPVGLKPSGGIRTVGEAAVYLALADEIMGPDWASPTTFRFGASSLLGDVLAVLGRKSRARAKTPANGY